MKDKKILENATREDIELKITAAILGLFALAGFVLACLQSLPK